MLENIKIDFSSHYPPELVQAMIESYKELKEYYYLNKHEPSELNGGKFVEACARILEQELRGTYTPLGTSILNMNQFLKSFETLPASHNDSLRIHIPRVLASIYNIRNRRGVGHLGGDVNANVADSTLIMSNCDWVMAEFYRMFYTAPLDEAQDVVNDLVSRKLFIVHNIDDAKRVLATFLSYKDQILLLLASIHPSKITDKKLCEHIEYSNFSLFKRRMLQVLHKERKIEYSKNGSVAILPPGLKYVENNYTDWLKQLNEGK